MPVTKTVTKYIVTLNPYTAQAGYVGPKLNGSITLKCRDGYSLVVGFVDTTDPLLPNTYSPQEKKGVAYRRIDQYPFYVDLARNEGPLSVIFLLEVTPPAFAVFTGDEPPGEGEI